jgi:hypothetical protein
VTYNTQTPTLPFPAAWHVRWKTDNSYTNAQFLNGSTWVDAGWNFTGNVFQSGTFFEMRIPRSYIGSPATATMVMAMLNEQTGVEATYAGVPSTAFVDSYNPSFAHYFSFDLNGCQAPTSFIPM